MSSAGVLRQVAMNHFAMTGCARLCRCVIGRVHTVLIHTHRGMWAAGVTGQVAVHDVAIMGCATG